MAHLRGSGPFFIRLLLLLVMAALLALVAAHTVDRVLGLDGGLAFISIYSLVILTYVVSRFALGLWYRPPADVGFRPSVAIVIPAYNEGASVARTIEACLGQDYPPELLQIICIDDGSTDDTWARVARIAQANPTRVRIQSLVANRGKRAAMALGARLTSSEIVVFIDSDSEPAPGGIAAIVQAFADERVGSASGLTHARNGDVNALTRMQAARYLLSFQLLKAAESVVGAVTCCSGCFAAYRRSAIEPLLDEWEHQRFLGVPCTYGDDRALTNQVIRAGHRSVYHSGAVALTDVPTSWSTFFRQQLRWKKSWVREGPILLSHLWRSRPLAFPFMLIAVLVGFLSPFIVVSALVVAPVLGGGWPWVYLVGLFAVASAYSLFQRTLVRDSRWWWSIPATLFYVAFSFQILWAVVRVRDGRWGTRTA